MESRFASTLLVSVLVLAGCQSEGGPDILDAINPDAYALETLMPENGGSDCRLIEVASDKEVAGFFVDGIRGEEACRMIGFWDRTVFAQVTPDDFDGGGGFYDPMFTFYSIDVDTGEVEDLGYFISWTDSGSLQHKGAFSTDGSADALVLYDFDAGGKITFVIPEMFSDVGLPFTSNDASQVVFSAAIGEMLPGEEWPTLFGMSIFMGDVNTGLAEEIYNYEGWLYLAGWSGERIKFSEEGKTCYLNKDGTDKLCVFDSDSWLYVVRDRVDMDSFQMISDGYAKDKSNIYFETGFAGVVVFEDADQETFQIIDEEWAIGLDKDYVYAGNNGKFEADTATFEILNKYYARDKDEIFFITYYDGAYLSLVGDADPASFQILRGDIAKDKNNVYMSLPSYEGTDMGAIEGADPASFEILGGFFRDKNKIYLGSKPLDLEIDVETFQRSAVEPYYFYDKNAIFLGYFELGRYEGIDQASFKITYKQSAGGAAEGAVLISAEDKNHHYELRAVNLWDGDSMWVYDSELHQTEWVVLD